MTPQTEREVVEREAERLAAEGFDVFIQPGPAVIPAFLKGYRPDAIAFGKGRKIALEVASISSAREKNLERIAELFMDHADWEFRVLIADPAAKIELLPTQSLAQIEATILEIEQLRGDGRNRAAFLLGWAAMEAASRALLGAEVERPQAARRLVEVLSREGYLTPADGDAMRLLADKRNQLMHGALDAFVDGQDVDRLVTTLQAVTREIAA